MKPDLVISTMNWGTNGKYFSIDQSADLIKECYNENLLKFDLVNISGDYSVENLFGNALQKTGINRDNIKISTKCGILYHQSGVNNKIKTYNTSKKHIITTVDNTLQNLKTNYIDVLFIQGQDYLINLEELGTTFTELKLSGKVKYFGVSNFSTFAFDALNKKIPLITNQIEFSLIKPLALFNETLLQLGYLNKKTQIYSPLGNYFSNKTNSNQKLNEALAIMAKKYDASISQILLAWTLKPPYKITPILGSTNIERIKLQSKAFNIKLSHEDWYKLLKLSTEKTF